MAVISHHCYYFDRASSRVLDDSYLQFSVLFVLNYSFVRDKDSPKVPKDSNDPSQTTGKYHPHSFVFNQSPQGWQALLTWQPWQNAKGKQCGSLHANMTTSQSPNDVVQSLAAP